MFKGQFRKNIADGLGLFEHANGDTFVGQWKVNVAYGTGVYQFKDGSRYEGCMNEVQNGSGCEV